MAERREVLGKVIRFWKRCPALHPQGVRRFVRVANEILRIMDPGEAGLAALREYVSNNPMRWADDPTIRTTCLIAGTHRGVEKVYNTLAGGLDESRPHALVVEVRSLAKAEGWP